MDETPENIDDEEKVPTANDEIVARLQKTLKARVKVIVEEVQIQNGKPMKYEPTVYEQVLKPEQLDLQAIIEATNKGIKKPSSNEPGPAEQSMPAK